jgi:hypothetical protein
MRKTDADLPLTCGERQPAGKRGRVFFVPNEETGDGDAEGHCRVVQPDQGRVIIKTRDVGFWGDIVAKVFLGWRKNS